MRKTILSVLAAAVIVPGAVGTATVAGAAPGTTTQPPVSAGESSNVYGKTTNSKGTPLKVRQAPNASAKVLWKYDGPTRIQLRCYTYGSAVDGNKVWYRVASGNQVGYVSGRWVSRESVLPVMCGSAPSTSTRPLGLTQPTNKFTKWQCTWGAQERVKMYSGKYMKVRGDAKEWAGNAAKNKWKVVATPEANTVLVMQGGKHGHVAWVTGVSKKGGTTYISIVETNFSETGRADDPMRKTWHTRTITHKSGYKYILVPSK